MNVKQEVLAILDRLMRQGFPVSDECLTEGRCTATVMVGDIPFELIAGKLSATRHYEIPPLTSFPAYLRKGISQLQKLGYGLHVAEFHQVEGERGLYLEAVLQLWGNGGVILSSKLTNDSAQAESFLTALRTKTVILAGGCSISIRGYDHLQRIQQTTKTFLGPDFQYVLVEGAQYVLVGRDQTEWTLFLPGIGPATGFQIVSLSSIPGDVPSGVTDYAKIEVKILAPHQE